jgi:CHAD domain-containing protein
VQDAALRAGDRALRSGDPSAVHDSRVAARRARSTLRTFGGLFEEGPRDALDASLQAYAARLGLVRDLQVLGDELAEHSTGALADWVAAQVQRELAAAWQQLERELSAIDHHHLGDQMAAVILAPPRKLNLGKQARRAAKKAERMLASAGDDAERLHAARKAAKRARYAAEATGHDHRAHRFKQLQDVLGTHHDLVVAADWIEAAPVPDELRDDAIALAERLRADADALRSRAVL